LAPNLIASGSVCGVLMLCHIGIGALVTISGTTRTRIGQVALSFQTHRYFVRALVGASQGSLLKDAYHISITTHPQTACFCAYNMTRLLLRRFSPSFSLSYFLGG